MRKWVVRVGPVQMEAFFQEDFGVEAGEERSWVSRSLPVYTI